MDMDFLRDIPGAIAKPERRKKVEARKQRTYSDHVTKTRIIVFGRERDICRCCRKRAAESMHEIWFRSKGGKVSRFNSIAVCGLLVGEDISCHTYLQRNQIAVKPNDGGKPHGYNAELTLEFQAKDEAAAEWMQVAVGQWIESPVMLSTEIAL